MACWGVVFDSGSAKWLAEVDKWVNSKEDAYKIAPSNLVATLKAYNAERLIKRRTLQYHLEEM